MNYIKLRAVARTIYHSLPLSQGTKWRLRGFLRPLLISVQDSPDMLGILRGVKNLVAKDKPSDSRNNLDFGREAGLSEILRLMAVHANNFGPVRHWIALPFLSTGGAEMVALNLCQALRQLRTDSSVALLITDRKLVNEQMVIPEGVLLIVFDDYLITDLSYVRKQALLWELILAVRPECFHNINSEVAWHLILAEGERLKSVTKIFASIFAFQFAPSSGVQIGYAASFLKQTIPYLTGLLSDNRRFIDDAAIEYELSDIEKSRMNVVYQPCRLLRNNNASLGEERIVRRRSRFETASYSPNYRLQILWAGRLDEEKRLNLFLEVVKACQFADFRVFGQVVLDIGSTIPDFPNLSYEGPFSSPLEWLHKYDFDAFVFTSRWEGLPNILIEVATLGIPIVAPTVGGVGELVSDKTGYPLPERPSVADYEHALRSIIAQPNEAITRSREMLDFILNRHTWELFVQSISKLSNYVGHVACHDTLNAGNSVDGLMPLKIESFDFSSTNVTVIIPCFNQGRYLYESVASALVSCSHLLEIIVVDDGSTDPRTDQCLAEVKYLAPEIVHIHRQINQGLSGARNVGIALARGDFIQFLDADDILTPGKIDAQIYQFCINPQIDISVCNFLLCDDDKNIFTYPEEAIAKFDLNLEDFLYKWERGFVIPIHCGLFRRSILKGNNFKIDLRAKEDWVFWTGLALSAANFSYVHGHWAIYRHHENSMRKSYVNMGKSWLRAGFEIERMLAKREPLFFESVVSWFDQCYRANYLYRNEIRELKGLHDGNGRNCLGDNDEGVGVRQTVNRINVDELLNRLRVISQSVEPILISVVIPIYNHYEHLESCLSSLAEQGDVSFEIICVDDASSDPRISYLLEGLKGRLKNLKIIINKNNYGISETSNIAVRAAEGPYIAFLDCDDMLVPYALQEIRNEIESEPEIDYFFTDRIDIDENDKFIRIASYGGYENIKYSSQKNIYDDLIDGMIATHLKVIKRSVYLNFGGCSAEFSGVQDWELALKISENYNLKYIIKSLYKHRLHSKSVTTSNKIVQFRNTNILRRNFGEKRFYKYRCNNAVMIPDNTEKIFQKNEFPISLKDLKRFWSTGVRCSVDLRGPLSIIEINFIREFNSYFDKIYWDDPRVPLSLTGYLWNQDILQR